MVKKPNRRVVDAEFEVFLIELGLQDVLQKSIFSRATKSTKKLYKASSHPQVARGPNKKKLRKINGNTIGLLIAGSQIEHYLT